MDWVKSKELREKQVDLRNQAESLVKTAHDEKRVLTADEQTAFDGHHAEVERISAELSNVAKLESAEAEAGNYRPLDLGRSNQPGSGLEGGPRINVVVPDWAKVHGRLEAFRGPRAEEDAYTAGQFYMAAIFKSPKAVQWCGDHGIAITDILTSTGGGGILVPTRTAASIIDLVEEYGVFRRNAGRWPMSTEHEIVPRQTGDITAEFVGDNDEASASDVAFDGVSLTARMLQAIIKLPTTLADDAIVSLADIITKSVARAFAKKEDECGFLGDGTSTYGHVVGVKNAVAAGSIVGAITGNDSFEELDLADFESCVGKLPQYAEAGAKWYISKAGWAASMMRLMDAAGGNSYEQLANGDRQRMFLGYPVVISQVLNSTLGTDASTMKCAFGNLEQAALFGDRRQITIRTSLERYIELNLIGMFANERFDINVHETGTASVPGSIIVLKSAA